jgi:hypothetical protein
VPFDISFLPQDPANIFLLLNGQPVADIKQSEARGEIKDLFKEIDDEIRCVYLQ